jgi:hypothetical protein
MANTIIALALLAVAIWALTLKGGVIALLFVGALLFLAYRRLSLAAYTGTFFVLLLAYTVIGDPAGLWKGFLWAVFGVLALLNIVPLRKALVSRPFMKIYRRMLPAMSSASRSRPARSGGTASCSPVNPTGRNCSAPRRRN